MIKRLIIVTEIMKMRMIKLIWRMTMTNSTLSTTSSSISACLTSFSSKPSIFITWLLVHSSWLDFTLK